MHDPLNLFAQYPWLSAACLWVFAALIHTMPAPEANDSKLYRWLHDFLQLVGANLDRIGGTNKPSS